MSYMGSQSQAKADINAVEMTPNRMATSPVRSGASSPGVSNAASSGELEQKRTKLHRKTSSLKRQG